MVVSLLLPEETILVSLMLIQELWLKKVVIKHFSREVTLMFLEQL